jgi:hypothetical protein
MEIVFTKESDTDYARLERAARTRGSAPAVAILQAVRRALGRLERDPGDRRLRAQQWSTPDRQIRMTPCDHDAWVILWRLFEEDKGQPSALVVIAITELPP